MNEKRKTILLVEDDALLALDLADMLMEAGYDVCDPAGSNEVARRVIERDKPAFALLDFNLGSETSIPTALELANRSIPFAYVTGRAEAVATHPQAPSAPVISKPYRADEILQAIASVDREGSAA